MSVYSVDGYLAALRLRSRKTILVEGTTDRAFLDRILTELDTGGRIDRSRCVVDTASVIRQDADMAGARDVVERINAVAYSADCEILCLVDREFWFFQWQSDLRDDAPFHVVVPPRLFWTRGHSVENYLITPDLAVAFLTVQHPEVVSGVLENDVQLLLPSVWKWAVSLGIGALESGLVQKTVGLLRPSMWQRQAEQMDLNWNLLKAPLTERGCTPEQWGLLARTIVNVHAKVLRHPSQGLQWMAHGHLGAEAVWTAVAAIALEQRCPDAVVEQIAFGHKDLKMRLAIDAWVRSHLPGGRPRLDGEAPGALVERLGEMIGTRGDVSDAPPQD